MESGQLTARQLVQDYYRRIEAHDKKGPALNAVLHINSKALDEADRLDDAFRKSGLTVPLHGVPPFVEDAIGTNDLPTTGGSLSLKGFIPRHEATIVRKLKAAGSIVLGKTSTNSPSAPAA